MERHDAVHRKRTGRLRVAKIGFVAFAACGLIVWLQAGDRGELGARLAACIEPIAGQGIACLSGAPAASRAGNSRAEYSQTGDPQSDSGFAGLPGKPGTAALVRSSNGDPAHLAQDHATLADLAAATYRSQAVTRARYLTVSQRCDQGLADAALRCGGGAGRATGARSAAGADKEEQGQRISGRVITTDGFGLPGVTLIASRVGGSVAGGGSDSTDLRSRTYSRYRAVSGADGGYSFDDLPEGDYTIRNNRHQGYGSLRITVRAGVEYADLVLDEERIYVIEGGVTDEYGSPMSHVAVVPVVVGQASARTDRQGRYTLEVALPSRAASITLRFEAPGFQQASLTAPLPASYTDQAGTGRSQVVLDARLESVKLSTNVLGDVKTSDGTPAAGLEVELTAAGSPLRYRTVTDADGRYEFPIVDAPATYELRVTGAPEHADYRERIDVSRYDYRFDVVVDTFEFGSLRGRIVDADGAPVPGLELAYRNGSSVHDSAVVSTDADGRFLLRDVPAGEAVLTSKSMPKFFVHGVRVAPNLETSVDVVLDSGIHELAGKVVDRLGRAVPASRVVLRWSHEADGIRSTATRRAATDSLGQFSFQKLGPGPHSLVVDAPGYATAAFDHDLSQEGYSVTVRLK